MPARSPRRWGWWLSILSVTLTAAVLWATPARAQEPAEDESMPPMSFPAPPPGAFVVGAGTATLGENFPVEFRGDEIFVALHARSMPNGTIGGVFTVTHHRANGELFAEVRGAISCLRIEGEYAFVSGTVTFARAPGLPGGELHEGVAAAIVVRDGGADGDRMAWAFGGAGPNCVELAPITTVDVEHGNFLVRD